MREGGGGKRKKRAFHGSSFLLNCALGAELFAHCPVRYTVWALGDFLVGDTALPRTRLFDVLSSTGRIGAQALGEPMATGRRRKRSARFIEIAVEAGVSPSTVDRVLNERGSASEKARHKVIAAAQSLGVPRILPSARHELIHIDVMLPDNRTPSSCSCEARSRAPARSSTSELSSTATLSVRPTRHRS